MKKTYRAFFVKHLATFLIPMLIPILVLGTLSTFMIQQYIKEDIDHNNMNLLKQTKENLELIFNELDSLNLHIVASATEFVNLRNMLQKPWLESDDYKKLASLKNFIESPNIARPYIDSIYIYLSNDRNQFITSTVGGLVGLGDFHDTSWFQSFNDHREQESVWVEARTIRKYNVEKIPTYADLITMYRKITVTDGSEGVIVLNIKTDYIENYLANLSTMKDQGLFIIDKNNKLIFQNKKFALPEPDIAQIISEPRSFFAMELGREPFVVSKLASDKYDWTFVSIIPKASLYQVPMELSFTALAMLVLSVIAGTVLAYYLTKKNSKDIKAIITILQSAEHGRPLPPLPSRVKDVYSYIIHRLLKNFLEHNYLKVQLSERKYKAQAMKFAALQSQLNPHFLFNTLETINWKAISMTGRPNELNHMVENLADILRYSLDDQHKMVSLQKEIIYTLSYMEIQRIRYKDRFDVIWDYAEDVTKYHVMKLILQPLIENSLYHGIKEAGKCLIKIKIRSVSKSLLQISVIDNGIGIVPEKLREIREKLDSNSEQTKHIGLYNTHTRLKLTYGEQYGLVLQSKFGWGTAVHLFIPKD